MNDMHRNFAIWCANWALKLIDTPDPLWSLALNTAVRHAQGEASDQELHEVNMYFLPDFWRSRQSGVIYTDRGAVRAAITAVLEATTRSDPQESAAYALIFLLQAIEKHRIMTRNKQGQTEWIKIVSRG